MAFGTLELTLRPLKLAFLVDPADTAALTEAIQINTFLWGGMFNPIIPVFRRLPAVWRERFHGHLTAQTSDLSNQADLPHQQSQVQFPAF